MSSVRNASAKGEERRFGGAGVGAFGEMLVIGLTVTALSLPLVTLVPALAAGARQLGAHLDHEPDSVRSLLSRGVLAIRSGWWFGALSVLVVGMLLLNALGAAQGLLPGGVPFAAVSGLLAAIAALAVLRTAALWQPGERWGRLWQRGRDAVVDDPIGDALILTGLAVAITVVWMLPPLVVVAPGLVVVSLVAAERRRSRSWGEGE